MAKKPPSKPHDKGEAGEHGDTIRVRFEQLRRIYPKRYRTSTRYPVLAPSTGIPKDSDGAMLFLYVHSTDDTYAIHETVFRYSKRRTRSAWDAFFKHYVFSGWDGEGGSKERDGILRGVILPAMNLRSSKQWDVISCIGYAMYDLPRSEHSRSSARRHQAES
jgi:hypothetical protein